MKSLRVCLTFVMVTALCAGTANAMPLNSSARAVIPADLQQLISVDYRALKRLADGDCAEAANHGYAG